MLQRSDLCTKLNIPMKESPLLSSPLLSSPLLSSPLIIIPLIILKFALLYPLYFWVEKLYTITSGRIILSDQVLRFHDISQDSFI